MFTNLNEIEVLAKSLIKEHLKLDWEFSWHNRSNTAGTCFWNINTGLKQIKLSKKIMGLNLNNFEFINYIIKHEIAHAMDCEKKGYSDHGRDFKVNCLILGIPTMRCFDVKEYNLTMPKGKFVYECIHCGYQERKHKKVRVEWAHGDCCKKYNKGKFSRDYLLILKESI